ncbi:hypothetical protein [Robiginitomaculum antarcticum]|uniref:hypothetical protein n=1 Tax=Robiginitomaculum antarcticum TaxID=437507 RepID=UPI00036F8E8B|nr:hypothetical protein [Robiginitomaculum antarcticum]
MMMDNDPLNESLKALLSDYAAPIPDDGFAALVKDRIGRRTKLRRALLAGASLSGGIIAGMQIPKLIDLAVGASKRGPLANAALPDLPSLSFSHIVDGLAQSAGTPMLMIAATGICLLWWLGDTAMDSL